MNATEELIGWKAIAGYLKVSEPTARRWTHERGLPVMKVIGQIRAIPIELDRWLSRMNVFKHV